eukprot:9109733-Pyramimonas_sp.AAC.1
MVSQLRYSQLHMAGPFARLIDGIGCSQCSSSTEPSVLGFPALSPSFVQTRMPLHVGRRRPAPTAPARPL